MQVNLERSESMPEQAFFFQTIGLCEVLQANALQTYKLLVTWFCLQTPHKVPLLEKLLEFQILHHIHHFLLLQNQYLNILLGTAVWT